ncbi:hypothetical protein [Gordonia sp. KTR9]|uniref:hypothetical protein n=1 Tax=Gordonia sp. KTR9 TaxID=337191 RepID=UPI0002F04DA0|nr:hypothetical protein [Gordonia sp. KTR9]
MLAVICLASLLVLLVITPSSPATQRSPWDRTRGRVGESAQQRRHRVERAYVDTFTRERRDHALLRVRDLERQVREALDDEDEFERLWPRHNELKQAIADYETCVGRRIDFIAAC